MSMCKGMIRIVLPACDITGPSIPIIESVESFLGEKVLKPDREPTVVDVSSQAV